MIRLRFALTLLLLLAAPAIAQEGYVVGPISPCSAFGSTSGTCVQGGGPITITSASASALAVGLNGATNPAFSVDASTASQAAGLKVTGAATGGTVAIASIDSGASNNLSINALGSGTIAIGGTSTGQTTIGGNGVLLAINSLNNNALKLIMNESGVARGYIGSNSTNSLILGNNAGTNTYFFVNPTTPVNKLTFASTATGTDPSIIIQASGADATRNLNLQGNGAGIVTLGTAICTVTGTTPQTCNGQRGNVTTGTLTTAGLTNAAYVINNSSVTTSSSVQCELQSYSGTIITNGTPNITTCVPGSGTITVNITNLAAAAALNGTIVIGFLVTN